MSLAILSWFRLAQLFILALYPRHSREGGNPDGGGACPRAAGLIAVGRGLDARESPILAFPRKGGRDPLASLGA